MKRLFPIFFIIVIGLVFIARLHMGLTRTFDPDEFSHLHWSYLSTIGKVPYKDFFHIYPPLFHFFLTPLFVIPQGPAIALAGRLVALLLCLGNTVLLAAISYQWTKNKITAFLTALIFITFPMVLDKTIELRPDNLMMLFFLFSIFILTYAVSEKNSEFFILNSKFLFSPFFLSLSLLTVPKIIFALPAYGVYMYVILKSSKLLKTKFLSFYLLSFAIPFVLLGLYFSWHHALFSTIDLLSRGMVIYSATGGTFSIISALSPWPLIYTNTGGYSVPFFVSTILWILSIVGIPILWKKNKAAGVFTLLYMLGGILTLIIFKRPHLQYFIPLAAVGSITVSTCIQTIIDWMIILFVAANEKIFAVRSSRLAAEDMHKHTTDKQYNALTTQKTREQRTRKFFYELKRQNIYTYFYLILSLLLCLSFFLQYRDRLLMQNEEQLEVLRQVVLHIPKNEPVYDMVGSFIFRPDGFPWTSNAYSAFAYQIQPNLKPLKDILIERQVKYIVLDQKAYVFWKPEPNDLSFIITHYLPSPYFKIYTPGVSFSCNKGNCIQQTLHGTPVEKSASKGDALRGYFSNFPFHLHITAPYRLTTTPKNQSVIIDGKEYRSGDVIQLNAGEHQFTSPWSLTLFTLQMIDQQ